MVSPARITKRLPAKRRKERTYGGTLWKHVSYPSYLPNWTSGNCDHEEDNPFARVRYGECLYETGNIEAAREHLQAAFDMEGEEIFDNEKYLKFITGE